MKYISPPKHRVDMKTSPADASPRDEPSADTLFIGTFFHDLHCKYAEAIGADVFPLFGKEYEEWDDVADGALTRLRHYGRKSVEIPGGYDNYLLEGGTALIPGTILSLRERDANVILLNADETFINVVEGIEHYGAIDAYVHRFCSRTLDGVVNVGEFAAEYGRRAGVNVPSVTVKPGIGERLYHELGEVPVSVGSKNVVAVGYGKNHPRRTGGSSTGFDLLVEAMPGIRNVHPSAELHIAGKGHPESWDDQPGVTLHGWVEDLSEFFSSGELSGHPGRSESFSVAALEPMRAARPCVVSDMVGAKEVARKVSDDLVCEPTVEAVRETIIEYFEIPEQQRRELCERARSATEGYNEKSVVADFVDQYESLCTELNAQGATVKAK